MRGVWKLALALAIVVLLTTGLSACGGGDSDSSSSTAATTRESSPPANSGDESSGSDDAESGDSSADEGSASFRTAGGDNSVQDFGEEATTAEIDAATAVLASYLQARAKGDWAKQCTLLAKAAVAPLEQLTSRSPQFKGKGCAAILEALMGRAPASTRANTMTDAVASLRFEGDRGFALYHGAHGVDYFVPMVKEDGEWKVGALAPSEFL
jgi:hypothetical protein